MQYLSICKPQHAIQGVRIHWSLLNSKLHIQTHAHTHIQNRVTHFSTSKFVTIMHILSVFLSVLHDLSARFWAYSRSDTPYEQITLNILLRWYPLVNKIFFIWHLIWKELSFSYMHVILESVSFKNIYENCTSRYSCCLWYM